MLLSTLATYLSVNTNRCPAVIWSCFSKAKWRAKLAVGLPVSCDARVMGMVGDGPGYAISCLVQFFGVYYIVLPMTIFGHGLSSQ